MSGPRAINPLLLDLPERIESERLLLRPPRRGDGPAVHEAIVESLPALRQFLASLPWVAGEQTLDSAETFCRKGEANYLGRQDFPFLLFERVDGREGRLVGASGLHRVDWNVPKADIGYWVRSSEAGKGWITEAAARLEEFGRAALGLLRVEIITDELNAPSRRVAERLGFELEGVHRGDRRAGDGSLRSTCIYAKVASDVR